MKAPRPGQRRRGLTLPAAASQVAPRGAQAERGCLRPARSLAALEQLNDADLVMGRHLQLVGDLEQLVDRYPLRERFWAQWMLALYRAERQAEALAVFDRVRRELVDKLGVEPGPPLQELHRRILRHDPALDGTVASDGESLGPAADDAQAPTGAAVRGPPGTTRPTRPAWRRVVIVTVVAVVTSVALAAALVGAVGEGSGRRSATGDVAPGVSIIDTKTGRQTAFISPAKVNQGGFTFADGHFWGAGGDPNLLVEIDPRSGTVVKRISPTLAYVGAYAVDGNHVWEVGASALVKIDIQGGKEVDRYALSRSTPTRPGSPSPTGGCG